MSLSVRASVTIFAGALSALYSCSLVMPLQIPRGSESNRFDSVSWIVPVRLCETYRHPSNRHLRRAWAGSTRGARFPPRRAAIPRSFSPVRCRSKCQRAWPLRVAGVPVVPGDTRDLLETTPGDDDKKSMGEEENANQGATISQRIESVSREVEIAGERMLLKVANLDDYVAIADVRFDVFSPVHDSLKHRFRERSCMLMRERRHWGAFCLVAALKAEAGSADISGNECDGDREGKMEDGEGVDGVSSGNHVLGTLECSTHEFNGTPLEVDTEGIPDRITRLYLTEVAVRSDCRRLGVGRQLMGAVDDVAKELETSEVFLHVNEVNTAALGLYAACGYEDAPDNAQNRAFTNRLGLAAGFLGQRHRLMHKTFPMEGRSSGEVGRQSPSRSRAPAA